MPDSLDIPEFLRRLKEKVPKKEVARPSLPTNRELIEQEARAAQEDGASAPALTFGPKHVPNVQEALREKTSGIIAFIEGMIDDGEIDASTDFYEYLRSREISKAIAMNIAAHFEPVADEFLEVMSTDDEDLKYAYRGYNDEELMGLAIMYRVIVDDCYRYCEIAKKVGKQRAKKPRSVEKIFKDFKFLIKDETWKVASIEPSKILGAAELWTFNVNNLALTVYRAQQGGLQVRGSHIENVDEAASESKRIGRKTEEKLRTVLDGGKVTLRKLFEEINGTALPLTRIGKNVILLRVNKF